MQLYVFPFICVLNAATSWQNIQKHQFLLVYPHLYIFAICLHNFFFQLILLQHGDTESNLGFSITKSRNFSCCYWNNNSLTEWRRFSATYFRAYSYIAKLWILYWPNIHWSSKFSNSLWSSFITPSKLSSDITLHFQFYCCLPPSLWMNA